MRGRGNECEISIFFHRKKTWKYPILLEEWMNEWIWWEYWWDIGLYCLLTKVTRIHFDYWLSTYCFSPTCIVKTLIKCFWRLFLFLIYSFFIHLPFLPLSKGMKNKKFLFYVLLCLVFVWCIVNFLSLFIDPWVFNNVVFGCCCCCCLAFCSFLFFNFNADQLRSVLACITPLSPQTNKHSIRKCFHLISI